jgi:beta-lactamase class A
MLFAGVMLVSCSAPRPPAADVSPLTRQLEELARRSDGRLGVCVIDVRNGESCVRGDERFSLQSVMKLIVAAAAMDAVDRKGWSLDDVLVVRRQDLSLNVQPLADIVRREGEFRTTVGDLIERAVTESDSAAADILFARLGGEPALREFLVRNQAYGGIRVDRDERHLQTEITGLQWRPEFVDPAVLARARSRVTDEAQSAAFTAYLRDPRDTATPRAMARFLAQLSAGNMLSTASTRHLLGVMERTRTSPGRLRAGAPAGWTVAHKTGTSGDMNGVNGVTNDVGVLTAPDGGRLAIVVFLGESRQSASVRDAVIASAARIAVQGHP